MLPDEAAGTVKVLRQETHFAPNMRLSPAQQVGDQIAAAVKDMASSSASLDGGITAKAEGPVLKTLDIQLTPHELGTVKVSLRMVGDTVEVSLVTSRAQTAELLKQDRQLLDQMLRATGVKADAITIQAGDDRIQVQAEATLQALRPRTRTRVALVAVTRLTANRRVPATVPDSRMGVRVKTPEKTRIRLLKQQEEQVMRKVLTSAFLTASIFSALAVSVPAAAETQNVCEREMISAARKYNVPLGVLYAVGLTETGRRNSLYPYALNIEGKSVFPPSRQAAKQDVMDAQQHGKKLIDIGCMQINHHYHGDQFRSVDQMLEPRANVQYAARFLKDLRRRQGSWTMAVARYHAGPNNDPAQKRYVCTVIRNMVASGFGNWTQQSKQFCGA